MDNDCDGAVDEGHVCPDLSVRDTMSVSGTVWTYRRGEGIRSELTPLWPTAVGETVGGFDRRPRVIGGPSGRVFYESNYDGHFELSESGPDRALPTPPCFDYWRLHGWFPSGTGEPYYICDGVLRREGGRAVAEFGEHARLRAVTEAGRALVTDSAESTLLVDLDGSVRPVDFSEVWTGEVRPGEGTVAGENIFVGAQRELPSGRVEMVVFRVRAESGAISLVRRIPVRGHRGFLPLPDGRVFAVLEEPVGAVGWLVEFPPDGPPRGISNRGEIPVYRP